MPFARRLCYCWGNALKTITLGAVKIVPWRPWAGTWNSASCRPVDETENGTEDIWWIVEGQDYPRLWWEAHQLMIED